MFDSNKQSRRFMVPLDVLAQAKFPEGCEAKPALLTIPFQETETLPFLAFQCQWESSFRSHVPIHLLFLVGRMISRVQFNVITSGSRRQQTNVRKRTSRRANVSYFEADLF